jgi:wyosine [tRNA(Phe)-imidazoG37] synthetase (radical SAM superfamily)
MTNQRRLELLKIERECIRRNIDKKCDRNCGYCDLVQKDEDLIELYDELVEEYEVKNAWAERANADVTSISY